MVSNLRFYTNFYRRGNSVYIRGYKDGIRENLKVKCKPTLYIPTKEKSDFHTLHGTPVSTLEFDDVNAAKDFVTSYTNVDNFEFYGSTNYDYVLVNQRYTNDYDTQQIRIANIDIEVESDNGFPEPEEAIDALISITVAFRKKYTVFGMKPYNVLRRDVEYIFCEDEKDLIEKFLDYWKFIDPDVITGWYVDDFDMPYLYNRISNVIDQETANRLSPVGKAAIRVITEGLKTTIKCDISGVSILDYIVLYKKFNSTKHEIYTLDYIATVELGEGKVDYSEVESLYLLYKTNYQKFIDYNIRDVELVDKLDRKKGFIDLVFEVAYLAKVNYNDVLSQGRVWDSLIHNHLISQNIVVPQKKDNDKGEKFKGAYVKEPKPGMYSWCVGFDLNRLYPALMEQYNISPETLIEGKRTIYDIDSIINREYSIVSEDSVTANGYHFTKEKLGFIPKMVKDIYKRRADYKNRMIESKKLLEQVNRRLNEIK